MTKSQAILSGLLLLLAVRVAAMVWVPLTDTTEARYAEIARTMAETGNWITPLFDLGIPYLAEPPLHSWLSASGIALFGVTAFAVRLGVLLSALATLAILWLWARSFTDRITAAVAVLLVASSGLFFVASALVQADMALTLGVTAAMAGFYNGLSGSRRWGWLFFAGLAVGLLAKGPVAWILSLLPIGIYMVWRGSWKDLQQLPWIGGIALIAILVMPWYVAAESIAPGYLGISIIGEHVQRYFEPGWAGGLYSSGPAHPRGMIWLFWILATLPWSPLLPILLWRLRKGVPRKTPDDTGLYLYLLLFVLTPLVLFTPVQNTIVTHVLPGVPAASLLAVMLWLRSGPAQAKWVHLGVAEVVVVAGGIILVSVLGLARTALPSEAALIGSFNASGRLAILWDRSFSAEFYTDGDITRLNSLEDLESWLAAGDGVMVPKYRQAEFLARFGNVGAPVAESRKYMLYIPVP